MPHLQHCSCNDKKMYKRQVPGRVTEIERQKREREGEREFGHLPMRKQLQKRSEVPQVVVSPEDSPEYPGHISSNMGKTGANRSVERKC